MSELFHNHDEGGYATLIAMIVIVVMGILLAGLLPFGTTVTQSAAYTRNTMQAQYLAEAGAKRAIVELGAATAATSWAWLGSTAWHDVIDNPSTTSRYAVTITPPTGVTLSGTPTVGAYTVTSVGQYGSFFKTVTVTVAITTADFSDLSADFVVGGSVRTTKTSANIQSNGDMTVKGQVYDNISFTGAIAQNNCANVTENANITIPAVRTYFDALRAKATAEFWAQKNGQELKLTDSSKIYYKDGSLVISNSSGITSMPGANGSNSYSIVVVDGDLTFSSDITSNINQNGNVVFVIKGDLHIDSNSVSLNNCCFMCEHAYIGDANAIGNANFTGKLVVENDLVLNATLDNSNPASFDSLDEYLESLVGGGGITVSDWAKGT
jgi:type II secretory pathway pseudopilin PulG